MKGFVSTILKYIKDNDKRFIIPVYQRNYNWKEAQCKQLFDDLMQVVRKHKTKHFFGSIVSVFNKNDDDKDEYTIIDGQQRVMTVSLMLLAVHNLLNEKKISSDDRKLADKILNNYLIDTYNDNVIIKLQPVNNKDYDAFKKLFGDKIDYIKTSNVTANYEYFYKRIQDENLKADELEKALGSLEIIHVVLDQDDDDPQLIFESLNSTGLDLSESDKIRNYILMSLTAAKQKSFYENYWVKIEENTKDENNNYQVDDFIRNYLSVKQKAVPAEKKIYIAFKEYFENNISRSRDEERKFNTEDLLKDMRQYSRFYNILVTANHDDKRLSSCIERLNWLTTTVTRPFFLEVLRLNADKKLTIDDVVNIFITVENYIFRRNICELPTNALNKMFVSLHNEIMKYDGTDENYFNKLKYALLTKKDNTVLPDDEDFADNFVNRQIYSRNNKNKVLYILERLENFGTLETKNIYELFGKIDGYSIEHIMPQTLTTEWTKSLGDNYKRIYDNWLNKIANLTLTAYNSNYSNRPFTEKRDMPNGFKDSGFKINQWLANLDKWGESELETRNEMLKKRALEIWPLPETNFKPEQKPSNQCSLDDDVDLKGTTLKKFSYKNIEYNAASWQDMFTQVIKALHSEDRTVLYELAENKSVYYVSSSPEHLEYYMKIDDGLYVWKNTNTKDKISLLRKFFQHFKHDPSDLIFYIDVKKEQ